MSDSEKPDQSADQAKTTVSNLVTTAMELKQSNPKVFFGGIAGVVVLLLLIMSMGGGSDEVMPSKGIKEHSIGQNYVLRGANSSDAHGKVGISPVPAIEGFDYTDEDPKDKACNHLAAETQVKVLGFQNLMGKKDGFINIEVLSGDCKGKKGWAYSVDVQ